MENSKLLFIEDEDDDDHYEADEVGSGGHGKGGSGTDRNEQCRSEADNIL